MAQTRANRSYVSRLTYVPALDGIRGLSVAAVLVFHAGFSWGSGGYLGVSSFFVLSGFLITALLVSEHETTGRIALLSFWGRRFRRLMPAALLCLTGLAIFVADGQQLLRLRADGLSALFYVANWRFLATGLAYENIFGAPSPVQHFWSLAIEEQFYLVYPPLVVGLLALGGGSRRLLWIGVASLTLASASLMAALYVPEQSMARVYYGTDTRAAELLTGALLALWIRHWPDPRTAQPRWTLQLLGFAGLAFSLVLWATATQQSGWLFEGGLLVYAAATAAIIVAALRPGPLSWLLAAWPLRSLGRISYGVYLYHWPIFLWLSPERTGLGPGNLFGLRLAVTLAVSVLSFVALERPIRSGRFASDRRVWTVAPVAVIAVAVLFVGVTRDLPVESSSLFGPHRAMPALQRGPAAPPRILVIGDSIAYNLGRALEDWAKRSGKATVWNQAVYGCGIARGGSRHFFAELDPVVVEALEKLRDDTGGEEISCGGWADWWPLVIERFQPDAVIVASGIWDVTDRKLAAWTDFRAPGDPTFDAWLLAEYQQAADVLSESGARVVWLTHPCIEPKVRTGPLSEAGGASDARLRHMNQQILPQLSASRSTVALLDLFGHVCPGGAYRGSLGRILRARPDGIHFSPAAARAVARWLGTQTLAILSGVDSQGRVQRP